MKAIITESLVNETLFNTLVYGGTMLFFKIILSVFL